MRSTPNPAIGSSLDSDPLILEPDGSSILAGVRENLKFFQTSTVNIAGQILWELRRRCRRQILDLLSPSPRSRKDSSGLADPEKPWIVTGHQAMLFHGGILAKNILADCLAHRFSGQAINLIVDQDIPEKQFLSFPLETSDSLQMDSIPLQIPNPDVPMEYQGVPDAKALLPFLKTTPQPTGHVPENLPLQSLFDTLISSAAEGRTLSDFFMRINHHFAEPLPLSWVDLPVSLLSQTQTFCSFAADWIRNAARVHGMYNRALADYRLRKNIRNSRQPLGDLEQRDHRFELPFWIFETNQPRRPLVVQLEDDSILIFEGDSLLGTLSFPQQPDFDADGEILREALASYARQIRPRAVTLTLFVRLFLADYFIHGLGGRRYEKINETLLREHYGIIPPGWAVASANLYVPFRTGWPAPEQIQNTIDSLQNKIRDLASHPESYLHELENPAKAKQLLEEKNRVIEIDGRLRLENAPSPQRRENFLRLQQIHEQIAAIFSPFRDTLQQQIQAEQTRFSSARVAYNREFFFGLFPSQDLLNLKKRIDNRIPCE